MQSTIVTHTFYLRTQRASNNRKRIFIYNINVRIQMKKGPTFIDPHFVAGA